MDNYKEEEIVLKHMGKCDVCGGGVVRGPGYYNGTVVGGFGLVCEGCMLAIGIGRCNHTEKDVKLLNEYKISHRGA